MKTKHITAILVMCLVSENLALEKRSIKSRNVLTISKTVFSAEPVFRELSYIRHVLLKEPELGITGALARTRQHEILGQLIAVSSKISALEQTMNEISDTVITNIIQIFPKVLKLELKLQQILSIFNQIDFAHDQMRAYLIHGYQNHTEDLTNLKDGSFEDMSPLNNDAENEGSKYSEIKKIMVKRDKSAWLVEKFTLLDFAHWAAGHDYNSVMALLSRLHGLIAPKKNIEVGAFEMFVNTAQEMQSNLCNLNQSPHQVLYNLYNTVALTELKGLTILHFSYMLLKMYNKGNFTVEAEIAQSEYNERTKKQMQVTREALLKADRSIYRCDPKQYVQGVTHTKLTKLLQGYIENEVNLNPYGTCRENCKYYGFTEYNGCYKKQFCAHQPQCRGKVVECRYVDSDMNICTSSNSDKRYEWIEYENGKVLGNKGVCQKKNLYKVDSWWRYLFWHCSYCLCLCDENTHSSDRYFNLRDVVSDQDENKIVTGIRLLKNNQIIHMQIQQGILTPRGTVDKNSLSWKPVDNYTILDDKYENNIDYHTMNWLERSIDMDEVISPPEHVVTGVRFRKIGTHLNLEVRITPINFTTGKVLKAYSFWVGNDNTDGSLTNPRKEILLTNPDIPIRNGPHSLNSKHDQFIKFQPTSFDTDAAQSTVPFIDSQVLTSKGFPVSGIGLIHRGKGGSGGFIAPKLISYDFTPHLKLNEI